MKEPNKNKFILTDVDDVLLDFMSGLEAFLKDERKLSIDPLKRGNYYLSDVLGISREDEVKIYRDYAHSEYFTRIPAKEHAAETLQALSKEGWQFVAITACHTGMHEQDMKLTHANRAKNLESSFGNIFKELHITTWQECKSKFLKNYESTWWVEDNIHFAHIGHGIGHKSIIMDSPRYSDSLNEGKLKVVKSWQEISDFIKQFETE